MGTYRPDIDGLRGLAVLSVIGFHAGVSFFSGGYVGVDIFFVISGFLITSIICRNLEQDTFSFADFYARRCKRIFPALIIVLVVVALCGWLVLLPDEFAQLGKHIASGAGFISNFALWRESGYFDTAAESKPLLHLWSLGIEEQFYLLWPPLLVWLWKRRKDVLSVTVGVISISFVLNVMFVSLWQASDMYYFPLTRFWELLLGAALALAHVLKRNQFRGFANIKATLGLILLILPIFLLTRATLFPGWWALMPTLGTSLLISAGMEAWINRHVFANRALVFVGLISYPLYLWHWPLLSYLHITGSAVQADTVVAVAAAFVLSWATYRIVEKPVRSMKHRAALVLAPSLIIVLVAGLGMFSENLHARSERYGLAKIGRLSGEWGFPGKSLKSVHTDLGYHFERPGTSPRVLFIGDSHMEQYYPRIDKLFAQYPDTTKGVVFVTRRACPPISSQPRNDLPRCAGFMEKAASLAREPDIDTIVIASAWNRYDVFDGDTAERAFQDLTTTIRKYRAMGKRVYLVLPIPRGEMFDPSRLVIRSVWDFGPNIVQRINRAQIDCTVKRIAARLTSIAATTGAIAINPVNYLCPDGDCPTLSEDGVPIYGDESHLRPDYVREHVTFLDSILRWWDPLESTCRHASLSIL